MNFQVHDWSRHAANPVFPPGDNDFDNEACMNPFVLRVGDEYWMYYAGGANLGRRICLAIAPVDDVTTWRRLGPLFENGTGAAFDSFWCVLPCVHRIGNKWHMYYSGRDHTSNGLQSFWGIGLATSDDLLHWTKYSPEPILLGDGIAEATGNKGIAGGGRIVEFQDGARVLYRMFYTLAIGTNNPDLLVDQAKIAVTADSFDGLNWFNKQVVMRPRLEADYENAAAIGLNVWQTSKRFRCIYAGIGSRFGAYSICEAVSEDALNWFRGEPDQNLALIPQGDGWEGEMVEYPNIVDEGENLRLFYCGNGYGCTGIGTATAPKLD